MKKEKKVTIRITEQQLKMLVEQAINKDLTKSAYMREIVDEKLKNLSEHKKLNI